MHARSIVLAAVLAASPFTGYAQQLPADCSKAAAPKQPCGDCSYNDGRCANECACEHYSATGRIDTPAPALCEHERVMVPIADRVGNTLWREKNPVFMQKLYPLVQLRKGANG